MGGKIIGFRGQKVPTATGADPEIVRWLEDALEQARRGEIEALLAVTVHGNDLVRRIYH
jgi:ABC-type methionine transport system permease subunit